MALYMVKYDLKGPLQNYPRLYASIKACGMAWHAMNNMWFVISSDMSAYKIADRVRLSVDADDKVFVSRLSSDSAWCGLKKRAATGSRSTCSDISKRGPSGRNRPKRLHDALPHADVPVVEIHRGVAVAGHQQELLAERGRGGAWCDVYPSVLVRRGCVHEPGLLPDARHARVDARRLEAGVDDGALRRRPAHHRGEHEQRMLEARQRSGPFVARVVGVHEDVGAGLDLVPRARFHLEHEAAAAGAGDDGTGNFRFLEQGFCKNNLIAGGLDRRTAFSHGPQVLGAAVIGLQAREAQRAGARDLPRQRQRRLARRDAAAAHADIELDVHVEFRPRSFELTKILSIVDAHPEPRARRERREAPELRRADDFVGDQHVLDAALDHRLGLGHFLAAHPDRARGDLAPRDFGALVGLGVGAHANVIALQGISQGLEIPFKFLQIDEQRGSIDLLQPHAYRGGCPHR